MGKRVPDLHIIEPYIHHFTLGGEKLRKVPAVHFQDSREGPIAGVLRGHGRVEQDLFINGYPVPSRLFITREPKTPLGPGLRPTRGKCGMPSRRSLQGE